MNQYRIVISHAGASTRPNQTLSLEELAQASGLHPELIVSYVEFGLIEPVSQSERRIWFEVETVPRLRMIQRLRTDMGVNLPGVAVILDLTDKIRHLQQVIEWREQHGF
ncbi:MAG TPA: chaperone modulator CbpM [Bacillota bacterium]|nr:chaperone modulator CbpM [Bacillota bacterium]